MSFFCSSNCLQNNCIFIFSTMNYYFRTFETASEIAVSYNNNKNNGKLYNFLNLVKDI